MSVKFHYLGEKHRLKDKRKIKKLLIEVIRSKKKIPGDLNYIFTNNSYIEELNNKFLKHSYPTDVISFYYGEKNKISGDVYIGLSIVRENSIKYKVKLENEILRVIIHGTLHLIGYKDYLVGQRKYMRGQENKWLKIAKEDYGIQI